MNLNKFSQAKSEFSHVFQMVRNHIAKKHFFQQINFISTNFTSNAKYGDTLHPHASKQFVHLQNYILSHTNRCGYNLEMGNSSCQGRGCTNRFCFQFSKLLADSSVVSCLCLGAL